MPCAGDFNFNTTAKNCSFRARFTKCTCYMLKDAKAFSSFSINSLEESKYFYEEILGLKTEETFMGVLQVFTDENAPILLYPKENHEAATFTVLNFSVADLEAEVDALITKGITFEQYKGEYIATNKKGISDGGSGPDMAWLKDPSGNIIALLQA